MGQSTTVIPTGGGGAKVQDSIPTNPQKGDFWVDTSLSKPAVKWYDGTAFVEVESRIGSVSDESELPSKDPAQIYFNDSTGTYYRSLPDDIRSASYTGTNIDTEDSSTSGIAFKPDGTKLIGIGQGSDKIYEYDLSTAWDISTASYTGTSISTKDSIPTGIAFKPDGTQLFEVGDSADKIFGYDLSTPWDISTASYTDQLYVEPQDTQSSGMAFKPDGTLLLLTGRAGESIYEYDLSTPWDISTASYTGTNIGTQDTSPTGIFVNSDGTTLLESGSFETRIYEYDLSTPWDISTASYTGASISPQGTSTGIALKPDGTLLFEAALSKVYEYQFEKYETF